MQLDSVDPDDLEDTLQHAWRETCALAGVSPVPEQIPDHYVRGFKRWYRLFGPSQPWYFED